MQCSATESEQCLLLSVCLPAAPLPQGMAVHTALQANIGKISWISGNRSGVQAAIMQSCSNLPSVKCEKIKPAWFCSGNNHLMENCLQKNYIACYFLLPPCALYRRVTPGLEGECRLTPLAARRIPPSATDYKWPHMTGSGI